MRLVNKMSMYLVCTTLSIYLIGQITGSLRLISTLFKWYCGCDKDTIVGNREWVRVFNSDVW